MKKFDAVIAGYTCVDLVPDFKNTELISSVSSLFVPGKLIEIDGISFVPGGVVANTGLAMKKFEKNVFLNGLVGDDFIGKIAIDWFNRYNLSEGIKTTADAGTAFSIVLAPPGIDRIFLESPGCNKLFDSDFVDFDAVSQSRLFHFGYPPLLKQFYLDNGSKLIGLFSTIQQMDVVTSLDLSLPDPESESGSVNWPEIMQKVLPHTDIFVPSLEEVFRVMQPAQNGKVLFHDGNDDTIGQMDVKTIRKIGKQIINAGAKILLIKAGHLGAYLLTGDISSINKKAGLNLDATKWNNCELWCNAYKTDPVKIKNSSGAGDTSVAAFLSAILDSEDPETALKYAALAGRNNLYCTNLFDDIDNWQQMTEEMNTVNNEIIRFRNH